MFPWDEEGAKPYFVNNDGFEWWLDKSMTKYALEDSTIGNPGLKDVFCFYVKKGDDISRVLINNKHQVLYETSTLDQMAAHIDILKIVRNNNE